MAIFKPGPVVGAISGSIGAVNFANARGSKVARARQIKTRGVSPRQATQQALMAPAHSLWVSIGADLRLQWNAAAADTQLPNAIGQERPITGWQLFLKWYLSAHKPGITPGTTLPSPIKVPHFIDYSMRAPRTPPRVFLTIQWPFPSGDGVISIQGARSFRTTQPSQFKGWVEIFSGEQASGEVNYTTSWEPALGLPFENEWIALRVTALAHEDSPAILPAPAVYAFAQSI